jgi:hypothetical protein
MVCALSPPAEGWPLGRGGQYVQPTPFRVADFLSGSCPSSGGDEMVEGLGSIPSEESLPRYKRGDDLVEGPYFLPSRGGVAFRPGWEGSPSLSPPPFPAPLLPAHCKKADTTCGWLPIRPQGSSPRVRKKAAY